MSGTARLQPIVGGRDAVHPQGSWPSASRRRRTVCPAAGRRRCRPVGPPAATTSTGSTRRRAWWRYLGKSEFMAHLMAGTLLRYAINLAFTALSKLDCVAEPRRIHKENPPANQLERELDWDGPIILSPVAFLLVDALTPWFSTIAPFSAKGVGVMFAAHYGIVEVRFTHALRPLDCQRRPTDPPLHLRSRSTTSSTASCTTRSVQGVAPAPPHLDHHRGDLGHVAPAVSWATSPTSRSPSSCRRGAAASPSPSSTSTSPSSTCSTASATATSSSSALARRGCPSGCCTPARTTAPPPKFKFNFVLCWMWDYMCGGARLGARTAAAAIRRTRPSRRPSPSASSPLAPRVLPRQVHPSSDTLHATVPRRRRRPTSSSSASWTRVDGHLPRLAAHGVAPAPVAVVVRALYPFLGVWTLFCRYALSTAVVQRYGYRGTKCATWCFPITATSPPSMKNTTRTSTK